MYEQNKNMLSNNFKQQVYYWTHMLDEAMRINNKYQAIPYSKFEMDELFKVYGNPDFFANNYDFEFNNGWILPDGRILLWNSYDGHHVVPLTNLKDRINMLLQYGYSINDLEQENESILVYDAITNSLIRFCIGGFDFGANYIEIGRSISKKQLYTLYDFIEYIEKNTQCIDDDNNGEFHLIVDIGMYIDENKNYHRPSTCFRYNSIDEVKKQFINDIKRTVKLNSN